ncbi:MAG: hypothetical protein HOC20_07830 [Chloroflexi bacterium]|jgi:hypothetical protein|nr:hypothetical protein [Chloroflexota bacterium]
MKIDAVIFDFGGVFTESPLPTCEALGTEIGALPGQIIELMFGLLHKIATIHGIAWNVVKSLWNGHEMKYWTLAD